MQQQPLAPSPGDSADEPEPPRIDRLSTPPADDPAAFAALYRRYVGAVYRYFYQRVGDPRDAEDLTASTFGRALASFARYREQGAFAAWLFRIAVRTLQDHQRKRRPEVQADPLALATADPAPTPEASAIAAERDRALRRLIRDLPPDQREALVLRFFGQLSTAETAAVLGRSEGAVKMLVHRAIGTLREHYLREGEP